MKTRIAFIGTVGVPNNYGGFEMFLDSCSPGFLKNFEQVLVTCDSAKYSDRSKSWHGVSRVFIPIPADRKSVV